MHRFALKLLTTALVVSCAVSAQDLTIGSEIHLQNKFSGGGRDHFLDTQGRVTDHVQSLKGLAHKWHVFTNNSKNRDNNSGTWKIGSAEGKKPGSPLAYGDKITLLNMYPGGAYLDEGDDMLKDVYGELFKRRSREQNDYPVFTADKADDPTEYWIVGGRPNVKKGATVKAGEWITLESAVHPGYFLRAGFLGQELKEFRPFNTRALVFTSNGHFGQGEQFWIPVLKQ